VPQARTTATIVYFKWGQSCPDLFIKKKKITQLINGKLDKNRYNKARREQRQNTSDL
jgi:aromatic ring-opening dioxygenase LigB subunit